MISTGKLKAMIANLRRALSYTPVTITDDYQIRITDTDIFSTGDNTATLPLLANAIHDVVLKSRSGTITVDGNGSSINGATTVTTDQARRYSPTATGWEEVT
jgi:hypothetical protein